jgi:hypothetical protein
MLYAGGIVQYVYGNGVPRSSLPSRVVTAAMHWPGLTIGEKSPVRYGFSVIIGTRPPILANQLRLNFQIH